jgi:aminopeptidase
MTNLAKLLVQYSVNVQPGDLVTVSCYGSVVAGMPMFVEVCREILKAGGHPLPEIGLWTTEEFGYPFFSEASDEQLTFVDPRDELLVKEVDCDITISSETNTRCLTRVDPARQVMRRKAYSKLKETFLDRASKGGLRWVLVCSPSTGQAQDAEMSLEQFEDFVYSATYADTEDPVSIWSAIDVEQARLVRYLADKRNVRLLGKYVDMSFSIEGRIFANDCGHINMPDGEISTGPVEDSANGWFESSFPAIYSGVDVGKVRFEFENGLVVRAEAEKNQEHLTKMLDSDDGSRRLGEFGIGTNKQIQIFTNNMLFDEKIGGTIHVAVGSGYPETGSLNKSSIHWDFLCDMRDGGQIFVDDELFYESGDFKV